MLPKSLHWYYKVAIPTLVTIFTNLLAFIYHYFSIPFLLKTLFSPWKRQVITKSDPGFHLSDIFGVISFNLISRFLGALIRTITIFSGLVILMFAFLTGAGIIIFFLLTPFIWIPIFSIKKALSLSLDKSLLLKAKGNLRILLTDIVKTPQGSFLFSRLGIPKQNCHSYLASVYDPGNIDLFSEHLQKHQNDRIDPIMRIILSLSETYPPLLQLLASYSITPEDMVAVARWYEKLNQKRHRSLLDISSLLQVPGIGKTWAYGYTPTLDQFAQYVHQLYQLFPQVVGRDKEIETLFRVLGKSIQNSAILTGDPGIGRHAIISGFAQRINNGSCPPHLLYKRILLLDLNALVAEYPDPLSMKKNVSSALMEGKSAGNTILVIDHIENFLSNQSGKIDLTHVFSELLSDGRLQIIGITTPIAFHQYILPNSTLTPLYEKVDVLPPSLEVVLDELEVSIVPILESRHKAIITYQSLEESIKDAEQYISEKPFPEKAIDLLDEALVFTTSEKKESMLYPHHIQEFLSLKTKIPIGNLGALEREKLAHLEDLIHKSVINQTPAVSAIADSLRRSRTHISDENRPLGSFLFLGPTGVGKTETARTLARIYYGSADKILRFDMSQYQNDEGIERLIGSSQGTVGELTKNIRDNPFSLLLLDEFEKADTKIYNLFLTMLDEGYVSDALGRRIDTKNLFIIATSNAGSEYIREQVIKGITDDILHNSLINYIQEKNILSPELLNRFDRIVVFTPLSEGHLREITKLQLTILNEKLAKQSLSVAITDDLIKKITTLGYDPVFGARAIKRVIAEKVENPIAQKLIKGELKPGEQIIIDI